MKPILMTGALVVTLALISYSFAIINEQRKKIITPKILLFLTIGIILDISATAMMIIGSSNGPFTLHGFVGYSALAFMLVDTILIWKFKLNSGYNIEVPAKLHLYSRFAYIWWVLAYITGSLLVMLK
jgi:hypothetical protein